MKKLLFIFATLMTFASVSQAGQYHCYCQEIAKTGVFVLDYCIQPRGMPAVCNQHSSHNTEKKCTDTLESMQQARVCTSMM